MRVQTLRLKINRGHLARTGVRLSTTKNSCRILPSDSLSVVADIDDELTHCRKRSRIFEVGSPALRSVEGKKPLLPQGKRTHKNFRVSQARHSRSFPGFSFTRATPLYGTGVSRGARLRKDHFIDFGERNLGSVQFECSQDKSCNRTQIGDYAV